MKPDTPDDDGEPLVIAMTRPSMLSGLTFGSIGVSFLFPGMTAMLTRSMYFFALIPVFLLISYVVCLKDVYLFGIAETCLRLKRCPNKSHWRCRSYAPR
jgi:type IV secretion system protein VirB3